MFHVNSCITKNRQNSCKFVLPESCNTVHPPFDPPKLAVFTQVTQDEIAKIVSISPTKSCLLDPLPTFFVKDCMDILLPSMTKLVNCSLSEGLVPDGFKKAVVTPLIKKASLPIEDLKNYRPVPGLSFISKLVERVVAKQNFNPQFISPLSSLASVLNFDAPTVWNLLPEDIRASPTVACFRKKLKTYLYAKAYPP